jgi:alkyl hydroperoxide reductase subunit AhpC|tara:strand:+ start:34985 stop:35818 length:834 start_codon:yes stop_codon:yes gene_type:complete
MMRNVKIFLMIPLLAFSFSTAAMAIQIGDVAPNFTAKTTKGEINLHQWGGNQWVVLFSHPGDFTPVCTTELAQVAKLQPEFKKRNTKVIALSVDSLKDHKEWIPHINRYKETLKDKGGMDKLLETFSENTDVDYPIISDQEFKVAMLYGMYHPNAKPNQGSFGNSSKATIRAVFIIDPNKIIQTILIYPKNIGRNFDEILRIVDALQLSAKYNISTPANWQMGDPVIVSNDIPNEDIAEKFDTDEVSIFENYLKMVKQPGFFGASEESKERSKGNFK